MPYTLLLADDSVTIQRVIELTFADEDVEVVAVGDGDQAIAVLDRNPPDIVLADVGMPGRTGYEVAEHVKSTPSLAHIPVLLLTGAFEPVDQNRANRSGCDGVLAKPFEPQLVIGRVRELLARPRPAVPDVPAAPQPPVQKEAPPVAPPAEAEPMPSAVAPPVSEIDEYFDRLDEAFASLAGRDSQAPATVEPEKRTELLGEGGDEVPELSLSYGSPAQAFEQPVAEAVGASIAWAQPSVDIGARGSERAAVQEPAVVVASQTLVPSALPTLGDAFSALLAAEQLSPPSSGPLWPVETAAPAPAPVPTEEIVDQVVERVMQRLSEHTVQRTIADVVSAVAERLVREEIERIKAALK